MNDIEYRYFYEVARTLNFNQAAENLFITQPALSRCISKIEQEFGTPMFIRSKRRVQLTGAGIALLNNYPLVQKAAHELHVKVESAAHGMNARMTIAIQEGHLITQPLKNLLDTFLLENKDIQLDVISVPYMDLFDQLNSHHIDAALSLEFPNNIYANINSRVLETRLSYALVSRDHPAAKTNDIHESLKLLNHSDLMIVKWSIVPNATSYILNQCSANGFMPSNVIYAPNYFTLYNWLIMKKGFALMDKGSVFDETVIAHLPLQKEQYINFCVYWNSEVTNPAVTRFISHVEKIYPDTLENDDEAPSLSTEFYKNLLGQPPCKETGQCTGCGQCHFET